MAKTDHVTMLVQAKAYLAGYDDGLNGRQPRIQLGSFPEMPSAAPSKPAKKQPRLARGEGRSIVEGILKAKRSPVRVPEIVSASNGKISYETAAAVLKQMKREKAAKQDKDKAWSLM
jgi:hypothetical protein